jgi:hypothetical protein
MSSTDQMTDLQQRFTSINDMKKHHERRIDNIGAMLIEATKDRRAVVAQNAIAVLESGDLQSTSVFDTRIEALHKAAEMEREALSSVTSEAQAIKRSIYEIGGSTTL